MVVRKLTKALTEAGHDITVYASDAGAYDNQSVTDVAGLRRFKSIKPVISNIIQVTPRIVFADFKNYDVIHCHNYYTFQNFIARFWNVEVPMILNPHGTFIMYSSNKKLGHVTDRLWRYWFLKRMDKVICVSEIEMNQARDLGLKKIIKIPNGIDLEEYKNLPPPGTFREKYQIKDDDKIILYVGRNHPMKGLNYLRIAYERLKHNILLVMVGASNNFEYSSGIMNIPPLYGENKLAAYVDADMLVLPSNYDIFGLVALEALACGTPAIVTNKCGLADYCEKRVGEPIVFPIDYIYLAIIHEINHPTKESYRSDRIAFARRFAWPKIAGMVSEVYRELAG